MAGSRVIDHLEQVFANFTRQVDLALAHIVSNRSISKDELRQLKHSVKAQLDMLEAYVFPDEQTLPHDAYRNTSSCGLHSNKLLALDLAGQRGLRLPPQPLDKFRHQRPTLSERSNLHSYQRPYIADDRRQYTTNGAVVSHSTEADQNLCDANGIQTVSSNASKSRPAPYPNIVIHVIYDTAPISPSEDYRNYGGHPLLDTRQHTDTESSVDLTSELTPDTPTESNTGTGTTPNGEARLETEARSGIETRSDIEADARQETDTGNSLSRNEATEGTMDTGPTLLMSTTANETSADFVPEKTQPQKKMKLRSDTRAELSPSEDSCGEALCGNHDTTVPDFPRKRKKTASRRGLEADSLSDIARAFRNVILSNDLDSHLKNSQSLSISPRQQTSRKMVSFSRQQFLGGLSMYQRQVERNLFGEKVHRLHYRATLAHFADDYGMIQADSQRFLDWTEDVALKMIPSAPRHANGRRSTSLIMDRIILICFPEVYKNATGESEHGADLHANSEATRKQKKARAEAARKIQDWLRLGKPCARLIREFGYGILLLVPSIRADENLRTMKNPQLMKFLDILKAKRPTFDESLAQANARVAQYLLWPRSSLGDAMSGVLTSSESSSLNTRHMTHSSSFATTSVAQIIPADQTRSRRSLSIDPSVPSGVTQMIEGAGKSSHEQPSVETSPNLPDTDMVSDKLTRDDTIETMRTTEIIMSDAMRAESGPASLPHFFQDAAYGVLPSPSMASEDER